MTAADTGAPIEAPEKIQVVTYELTPRLRVDVPVSELQAAYGDIGEMGEDEILDVIQQDTDRLPDALARLIEGGTTIDIDLYDEAHEIEKLEPVRFSKPADGEFYLLPIPNFISGNVLFTENGIEVVEESPLNNLSDAELKGAYFAGKRIWGLRGMHRYQQEQLAEFMSELQWGMLARPSLHTFKPSFDGVRCLYCSFIEGNHGTPESV